MSYQQRFDALREELQGVTRKKPVTRVDTLVTCAGRLRCEAWVDLLNRDTPFIVEIKGALFPITIHFRDVLLLPDVLRRYTNEHTILNNLFMFNEVSP